MASILHRLKINCSPAELYAAITLPAGLSAWWTEATLENQVGSVATFKFGPNGGHIVKMRIDGLLPDRQVRWQCVEGPWKDTGEFVFDIEQQEDEVYLAFAHNGWSEQDGFFMHCNSKWGYFLVTSLKSYLERGTGYPHPLDPSI